MAASPAALLTPQQLPGYLEDTGRGLVDHPQVCSSPVSRTSHLSRYWRWGGGGEAPHRMNHSSVLRGVATGLSRMEKHPPDSQVPQPRETTGGGWWTEGEGPGEAAGGGGQHWAGKGGD